MFSTGYGGVYAISIHALVKRATSAYINPRSVSPYFNPRPREEGDAPVTVSVSLTVYFNPRPREEGDGLGWG